MEKLVTPCTGVWIEIGRLLYLDDGIEVTPCTGVWIEISIFLSLLSVISVTPCTGVWIEMLHILMKPFCHSGHSLHGSVD